METFDIEQQQTQQQRGPQTGTENSPPRRTKKFDWVTSGQDGARKQLISLREYSMAICLVELLAIVLLIYILLKLPPAQDGGSDGASGGFTKLGLVNDANAPYRTYSDHLNSAQLLLGLVPNCTQRRHDLPLTIRCLSRQGVGECPRLPERVVVAEEATSSQFDASGRSQIRTQVTIVETTKAGLRLAERYNVQLQEAMMDCNPVRSPKKITCANLEHARADKRTGEIIGWGGALTDSTINNVLSLTTNGTRNLLDDYFGPAGLRFNMVRITIGGSDFSSRFYTNDRLLRPNAGRSGPEEFSRHVFKLMEEDQLYKIPMLKFVKSEYFSPDGAPSRRDGRDRKLLVFASMWSPPLWMKTNRHFNKGHLRSLANDLAMKQGNANETNEAAYEALARLKEAFLEAYISEGIDMWGLTVMNEPVFAIQPFLDFNTMIFPREDYGKYVAKYLGPILRNNKKLESLKLMIHDDNRRFINNFTRPLLERYEVMKYIDGVSVHGYIDEEYWQMRDILRDFNISFVLPTELCSGHLPFMEKALAGNWHRGMHYALDIIRSLEADAAGWVDWNMVLDMEGGPGWLGGRLDAPVLVDKTNDLYHKSPMYYVLGQFSRYIPPGSRRMQLDLVNANYDNHFEAVAFDTTRGEIVIVVVNNNPYPVKFYWAPPLGNQMARRKYYETTSPADGVQTIILKTKP